MILICKTELWAARQTTTQRHRPSARCNEFHGRPWMTQTDLSVLTLLELSGWAQEDLGPVRHGTRVVWANCIKQFWIWINLNILTDFFRELHAVVTRIYPRPWLGFLISTCILSTIWTSYGLHVVTQI